MFKLLKMSSLLIFLPVAANAHPGHGIDSGLLHWLTSPLHLGVGIVVALALISGLRVARGRLASRPLSD